MRICSVKYKFTGEQAQFDAQKIILSKDDVCLVSLKDGLWLGKVVTEPKLIDSEDFRRHLFKIQRKITKKDDPILNENKKRGKEAFQLCKKIAKELNIKMKHIAVEFNFDRSKVIFYYTAEGRVDFRELVKRLLSNLNIKVEMRQIGIRDETKTYLGCGMCGQQTCCSRFLTKFEPINLKMAKVQNLDINTDKITGVCGRLMCCLVFEQKMYEEFEKSLNIKNVNITYKGEKARIVGYNPVKATIILRTESGMVRMITLEEYKELEKEMGDKDGGKREKG